MTVDISLQKLIETGAHFGHQSKRWNPKMEEYLHGVQEGVHVFDLIKTKEALEEVFDVLEKFSKEGKKILLLGTKKQCKEKVEEVAVRVGVNWVNERWLGGTITNYSQIKKSTRKLVDMKEARKKGDFNTYTKKERVLIDREIARLERFFSGIVEMNGTPDLLFVIDTKREFTAVREASEKGVTTIGIVDSNSDPTVVDYPIPMNDDATKALEYVLELIGKSIEAGKKKPAKSKETKEVKEKKTTKS